MFLSGFSFYPTKGHSTVAPSIDISRCAVARTVIILSSPRDVVSDIGVKLVF
jgi:hypothetical protein